MARKPMVTRTITTTKVIALCLNIETGEAENHEFIVPRTYEDETKLLKVVQEAGDTETLKVAHIVDTEIIETLYGMTEQDFIANGTILPPRGAKSDEESENKTE